MQKIKPQNYFITGTDTGVGKTIVTGLLAKHFLEQGYKTVTQKWIQTGIKTFSQSDVAVHLKIMGKKKHDYQKFLEDLLPYSFKLPASPHLAAREEKVKISKDEIIKSFMHLRKEFEIVLVEGVGGVLVPYNDKNLVIDIAAKLKLPVIIVVENKLGAVNHTLLTIEALKARKMKIAGLIFNQIAKNENPLILESNKETIVKLTKVPIIGEVNFGLISRLLL